ncbi:hypothetical protein T484DRAFT_1632728, partial [Baffinella frigidus]
VPTPTPETLNPKPETRNPESETRNPKPETRNPEHETRNSKPEIQNPKPETTRCWISYGHMFNAWSTEERGGTVTLLPRGWRRYVLKREHIARPRETRNPKP